MILTNCAVCATELGLSLGKKCGRCSTRYCGPACQKQHWDGGHKVFCKKIKKAGGAEQYNANKKYAEAVAVAVEACADDTKGQTCYICTQALHWKTKEGLVRGCSCRGTAGLAHVSCLAEQAKILFEEAEENNLGEKALNERFRRWHTCSLCEQRYHGVVKCALGWACWKTYLGRTERQYVRLNAISELANGLASADHDEDALRMREVELSMMRRVGTSEENLLITQGNLSATYQKLGRVEEALQLERDVYSGTLRLHGEEHERTLTTANNYAILLCDLQRFEEAKVLLRKIIPVARRVVGNNDETTIRMRLIYAQTIYKDANATLVDLREAMTTLEDAERTTRRVLGGNHPLTTAMKEALEEPRAALRAEEEILREICAELQKHVRSYLSPEHRAVWRQVCHEWLREIEDESRESRATVRAGPRDAGRPGPA
jgi:hypothetical protein